MDKLKQMHGDADMYVLAIDQKLWATPFQEGKTWTHNTSNIVESVIGFLGEDRNLGVIQILDAIANRIMETRFVRHKDATEKLAIPGAQL